MDNEELIIKLEQFKNGLMAVATDGGFDDNEYSKLRSEFLKNPLIKNILPQFVKIYRTPLEFRRFMQEEYATYAERRSFITAHRNKVIFCVEEQGETNLFNNINAYELGRYLGKGGFGQVYLYYHKILDINFAIKFFDPSFPSEEAKKEGEKRFFREAKILFELHSDNIVQVYDAGYLDGKPFIRMEYIDGYDMNQLLQKYSIIPFKNSLTAVIGILTGLEYAHKKGIIHRDLKPSNVMFSNKDKNFKIIDFGISAFMDITGHTKLTRTGEIVAGGSYIDPQLQVNPKLRDPRSDIYSVGAIWYYLLTNQVPTGSSMEHNLISIAKISKEKASIVLKCLEYDLDGRYNSCEELRQILIGMKKQM